MGQRGKYATIGSRVGIGERGKFAWQPPQLVANCFAPSAIVAAVPVCAGGSGSGPSVFMLSESSAIAEYVREAMNMVYGPTGIDFNTYVSRISPHGVRVA